MRRRRPCTTRSQAFAQRLRLRPRRGGPAARGGRAAAQRRGHARAGAGGRLARRARTEPWPHSATSRTRISSVKNIQKITRAMEMVAAARLRRAEQRIAALRPYADALRRMTRQAAQAAGAEADAPAAALRARVRRTTSACCSSRATAAWRAASTRRSSAPACASAGELRRATACRAAWYATGRRGVSSLTLPRPRAERQLHRLHRQTRLRGRALDRRRPDHGLRRRQARPRGDRLQRLHLAADPARHARDAAAALARDDRHRGAEQDEQPSAERGAAARARWSTTSPTPRRSSSGSSRTTSRSRSTARSWSRPRASSARR